jgi:hypothetical protein
MTTAKCPGAERFSSSFNLPVMTDNPNLNPLNGTGAANPFRLDRSQAATNDQDHNQFEITIRDIGIDKGLSFLYKRVVVGNFGGPWFSFPIHSYAIGLEGNSAQRQKDCFWAIVLYRAFFKTGLS